MSYLNKELKFIVGSIAGFIIGVVVTAVFSPYISDNQYLVPIAVVCLIGFPILLCTRSDMKSLLITLGIIILFVFGFNQFNSWRMQQGLRNTERMMENIKHQRESSKK